ncbi:MAG: hypothetical protein FWD31_03540, partial [Planctomycetaceae bacterium]|nr:hypothetical protein [Planctomycetaceae bacterium]
MAVTRTAQKTPVPENMTDEQTPRYVVGIDLGTTNSAVCYVDLAERSVARPGRSVVRPDRSVVRPDRPWRIRTFAVPQLVAAGLVESRETLPSFHYEPHANELSPEQIRLPF